MPTLRHLIEELRKYHINPDDVKLSGQLYDDIVADAQEEEDVEEG